MYDLDHMLNGQGSREHQQNIIRQVQQDRFARKVEAAQGRQNTLSPLRALLVMVIHMIWR